MNCIQCGTESIDRVVVEPASEVHHGGLCTACEETHFGVVTAEPTWQQPDGCGLCGGEATYALPRLDCLIEWDDTTIDIEYSITDATLELCHVHLSRVLDIEVLVEDAPVHAHV